MTKYEELLKLNAIKNREIEKAGIPMTMHQNNTYSNPYLHGEKINPSHLRELSECVHVLKYTA